jgi:cysteine desulfurase/selenocysteine lyase
MTSLTHPAEAATRAQGHGGCGYDVEAVRRAFPALHQQVHGKPLVYLDNAATTHKPVVVIEAMERFYREQNSNVHRGVHTLSQVATQAFEDARRTVARFLGAASEREIVFTRGTTEAINLVAWSFGAANVRAGDAVLITEMEHHSNIVPWQLLCERVGAKLLVAPIDDRGELVMPELERLLGERPKILAVTHASNALGTVNPVREICARAREHGVPVLVDGAQGVHHRPVNVVELGCDFYAFSGHKAYGPTGIGALYARREHLEAMPPWQGGGDMILSVTFEKTVYNEVPQKFEAGTPNIAGAVGLAAALDYLTGIGLDAIGRHEAELLEYATGRVLELPGIRIIGTAPEKAGILSFLADGAHPHDLGTILDGAGVAVRAGHHCAQPVMERFRIPATTRASFALYNTIDEVDRFVEALEAALELLR